ncbi:MAG: FAD-dependent oxidoreductase [Thiohalophilus sp.]
MTQDYSWGRYPDVKQELYRLHWDSDAWPDNDGVSLLAHGQGRSYGDVGLNQSGILLDTRELNRFIQFDPQNGILRCEAGVTLAEILNLIVPHGWFLPVTPGTRFVSIGGAIANDVHGKNHHRVGTFGCHVNRLGLRRSDGAVHDCSQGKNKNLFKATIGGLGLTGLIVWAEIKLKKIKSTAIQQQALRFENLDAFFTLSAESDQDWEYTVAWIDCLAKGKQLGRGIFYRGNHADARLKQKEPTDYRRTRFNLPLTPPGFLLNHVTVKMFNQGYYRKPLKSESLVHFDPFFYPLDKIGHWNRLYGKRGFFQYQCVIPQDNAHHALPQLLKTIADSGQGSFLSVLKQFGDIPSPGLLSFPRPGVTLALDFANRGRKTLELLERLDGITVANDGAVYPAKDARMSPEAFQHYYPDWETFQQYIDPAFSSSFWRRVSQQGAQI